VAYTRQKSESCTLSTQVFPTMVRLIFTVILVAMLGATTCHGLELSAGTGANPVTKVVNMLNEMVEELEHEAEADKDLYEEMGCWCETNDKEKTKAVGDGESRVNSLGSEIQSLTSTSARLNAEIKDLTSEVTKNDKALDSATALRKKQLAEFNAEEKDMLASITSMKGAVTALSKHHESSFLQESTSHRSSSASALHALMRRQLQKHASLVSEVITPHQQNILDNYFEISQPSMLQTTVKQPQSGQIFGILKGMKESFEKNLENSQKEETENNNAYEDLKAAKTSEIAAGKSLVETKTQELAAADEKNAADKQDLEDTQDTLEEDVKFLANVKSKCESLDAEFQERTKTRQLEIQAVGKALSFLNSDEAHDLFTRTLSLSQNFLQMQQHSLKRSMVAKLWARASMHMDPRFAALQVTLRNAAFEKVVKNIQEMVDKLTTEQKDEVALRDLCIDEFHNNNMADEEKHRDKDELTAKIEDFASTVKQLGQEIEALKKAIAESLVNIRRGGEDRAKQNKEFQTTVADQRATQKLIKGALNALKGFYGASFLQQPAFEAQEKNKKSGGVMGMMQTVISDAQTLEAEAIRGEEEAQKAYEDFVKDTNASIDTMKKDLVNKTENKAKATKDMVERSAELDGVKTEITELQKQAADLHSRCDFVLKNFELRQSTRGGEIASLKQAINILGGNSFIQFLQKAAV